MADYDWDNLELRASCVAYARSSGGDLRATAEALGMNGEDGNPGVDQLREWMKGKDELEIMNYERGNGGGGCELRDSDGAVGSGSSSSSSSFILHHSSFSPSPDPLEQLLGREDETLSGKEKAALLEALEQKDELGRMNYEKKAGPLYDGAGRVVLTGMQRTAVAVALRGADAATRRELVVGLLRFLTGCEAGELTEGWKSVRRAAHLCPGWTWRHGVPFRTLEPKWKKAGRSMIEIFRADGSLVRCILFARVNSVRPRAGGAQLICFRQLDPVRVFGRAGWAERSLLLLSLVTTSGTKGKEWAKLFGRSRDTVSHHSRKLMTQIQEATGGRAGFRNLEAVAKPKGKRGIMNVEV